MKHKIFLCSLAAALIVCGALSNQSFAADKLAAAPARAKLLQRLADKLDLTGGQRAQIKTVIAGEKETLAPLLAGLHDARKDLRAAIRASDANEASVRAASAKVAAAESDLAVERLKLYGKIAPILTDAQRQQLAELQERADNLIDNVIAQIGSGLGN